MKTILDYIKEMEGLTAPADTIGIGNPIAPTENTLGSEPLVTRKKCKKCKKVKESIFDDELYDDTTNIRDHYKKQAKGEDKLPYLAEWIYNNHTKVGKYGTKSEVSIEDIKNCLVYKNHSNAFEFDYHKSKNIPKDFLTFSISNYKDAEDLLNLYTVDNGNFTIEIHNEKILDLSYLPAFTYGDLNIFAKSAEKVEYSYSDGKKCPIFIYKTLRIAGSKLKEINWPTSCSADILDLGSCVIGKINALPEIKDYIVFPESFISNYFKSQPFMYNNQYTKIKTK